MKDYIDPPGFFDGCVWPMYVERETTSLKDPTAEGKGIIHYIPAQDVCTYCIVINGHQAKEEIVKAIKELIRIKVTK